MEIPVEWPVSTQDSKSVPHKYEASMILTLLFHQVK